MCVWERGEIGKRSSPLSDPAPSTARRRRGGKKRPAGLCVLCCVSRVSVSVYARAASIVKGLCVCVCLLTCVSGKKERERGVGFFRRRRAAAAVGSKKK